MWKNYLAFTRKERVAILLLLVIIFIGLLVRIFLAGGAKLNVRDREEMEKFRKEIIAFEASRYKDRNYYRNVNNHYYHPQQSVTLFDFDPNTADSITFIHLGLRPFMARMILKYRAKGGKYRKAEDFARVPFLDKALYQKLLPHIRIDQRLIAVHRDTIVRYTPVIYQKQEKLAEGMHIDLNAADTSELKKVPGIGSGIARAIVSYRSRLGGFYCLAQLNEIRQLTPEQTLHIGKYLTLTGNSDLKKIEVNKWGVERLMTHPYLNFYQAKAIVELRKKKGKLTGMDQLSLFEEFTKQDFERLSHYLDFSR